MADNKSEATAKSQDATLSVPYIFVQDEGSGSIVVPYLWGRTENSVRVWHEKGCICWVDESTGKKGFLTWRDALERLLGLAAMVKRMADAGLYFASEVQEFSRFYDKMRAMIREARDYGCPTEKVKRQQ